MQIGACRGEQIGKKKEKKKKKHEEIQFPFVAL